MRRFAAFLILVLLPLLGIGQNVKMHRNIGLDSVASILGRATGSSVYFVEDDGSRNTIFTIKERVGDDLKGVVYEELKRGGYSVTEYNGDLFILKGDCITGNLPSGYFNRTEKLVAEKGEKDYIDGLLNLSNVALSANKIYEVGDRGSKSGGKAYMRGYVRDAKRGEPAVGVVIYDSKSKAVATTDGYGFYNILLPVGRSELELSGYALEDTKVSVQLNGDGNLDIIVREKVYSLKGIVVSAESSSKLRNNEMGLEKVRMERIKRVPTVFGEADVVKVILTLPGVKSVGEASNGFNVRGGATDQNLVLFNGGTIYNPSHLFGMFSTFNPDVVKDIELYKSSIPVEYGGRISSVLDVNSREGNNKEIMGSLGLGLLTARGHLEGPIGGKTTFIAAARATYSDWMLGLLPDDSGYSNGTASFYDGTIGLTHKFNDHSAIYLNGYYSLEKFKFTADTSYNYNNSNWSVRWHNNFHEKHTLELSAGYGFYGYSTVDKHNDMRASELKFNINQGFAKLKFNSLLNDNHTLTYGADATYYNLMPGSFQPYGELSIIKPNILDRESGVEASLYLGDSWKISDRLFMDYGLRMSMFNSDKFYANPELRISGRYMINGSNSIKLGFNSMTQYIHMLSNTTAISPTDIWKLSDSELEPQTGWQAAMGYYTSLADNRIELSVEAYYKKMENYLDYKSGAIITMNPDIAEDVVQTKGRSYGAELLIKKDLGKLNGWVSYTYSKSELKEDGDRGAVAINGGKWYDASYDKPHDVKLVGNYKFTHRFSISLNMDYSTGRPVSIPVAKYYYGGGWRVYYADRNSYRIPDYFRLDAAINIEPTHKLKAFTHFSFTVGVYNVTGRKNAYSVYFDTSNGNYIEGHKLCVFGAPIPYINLNFKF